MMINSEVQELIYRQASAGEIKKLTLDSGLRTLRMDGAEKVRQGLTSIAEVLRVTQADIM